MTAPALTYLVAGVFFAIGGAAFAVGSYNFSHAAGHFSSGEERYFEVPEATATGWALFCAVASGVLFTLSGACLNASMEACA